VQVNRSIDFVSDPLTFNRGKCAGGQMKGEFTRTAINISHSTDLKSWDSIITRKNAVFASLGTVL